MTVRVRVGLVIASMLAGCGRLGFADRPGDAAIDTPSDVGIDASGPSACWAAWHTGAPQLGPVVKLTALDTDVSDERDPSPSDDGLTLYFTSGAAGSGFADAMMSATRTAVGAPWTLGGVVPAFDSWDVSKLAVAAGDTAVVISGAYGNAITEELWSGERASKAMGWGAPSSTFTGALNNINHQLDPALSADGTVLYYSELTALAVSQLILRTTRANLNAAFTTPEVVATGSTDSVGDPAFSPDELVLLYTERSTIAIAISTRSDASLPFVRQGELAGITTADAHDGALSRDGCALFFSSSQDGTYDLYEVDVVPAN